MSGPRMVCPFCASEDVESVSAWGGQLITRQLRCRACSTYFEAVRDSFSTPDGGVDPVTGPVDG